MSPALMLAKSLLLPGSVAVLVVLALRWLWRSAGRGARGASPATESAAEPPASSRADAATWPDTLLVPAALATGYAAGHLAIAWPAFPPLEVTDRVIWIAITSLLAALLSAVAASRAWWQRALRAGFSALAVGAMVGPIYADVSQTWSGLGWTLGLWILLAASWANIDALAGSLPPAMLGVPLAGIALGTAAALTVSGSVVLGQLCAALAAALAAVLVVTARAAVAARIGPVCSLVLGALLIDGYVYSELPAPACLLLTGSPIALWSARIPAISRGPAWLRIAVVTTLAAIPVAVAVALSFSGRSGYGE